MLEGREDVSGIREEDEGLNEEPVIQDSEESGGDNDEPRKESVRETVERVFKEARDIENARIGNEGEKNEQNTASEQEKSVEEPEKPQKKKDNREFDPELQPPHRLDVEEKELYNTLPKGMKRAFNRALKNLESRVTRKEQEYSTRIQDFNDIENVVRPFVADWAEAGFSRSQAIAELIGTHEKLKSSDKKVRMDKLAWLCENCKVGVDELYSHINGQKPDAEGGNVVDISNHPKFRELEEKYSALMNDFRPIQSNYHQSLEQSQAKLVQDITAEMEAVRHEKDPASGKYLYPELHDENFLQSVKPLVSGLVGTVRGITYGEALKRAYYSITGKSPRSSAQPYQTNLPVAQSNSPNNRALSAAVSVRGKSGPTSVSTNDLDIPPEALKSPRASAEWALQQLRRRG